MADIKAVVFDMDGLMLDSEPVWHTVEQEVFKRVGVELTTAHCVETLGLRIDEIAKHHARRHGVTDKDPAEITKEMIELMVSKLENGEARPMAGLKEALAFAASKQVPLAVASSSPMEVIQAALKGLGITDKFAHVCSAAHDPLGKPHPAVYLRAAELLGVEATQCLALEDSVTGALAAKAARMTCITVPDRRLISEDKLPRYAFTDAVLESLHEFNEDLWAKLSAPAP
ncbi:Protein SUPPRESSOR OF QUENCHING 1, chloroplastic [Hondaea fermentalgiana]|uniref:Protein SUPPRESSOR OF QUENCHING 1, chloroplastic n=1 Tax=Hondaea fermentalgiana TaxID=2315210 RepID=A0A2R5GD94_9STRA|nr:Protein SUPPRESSOR OF QUENCHING 1, chloroplastic [Hondaea fermentalgiana]|eukprot:GBG28525.1 Protein SUPPRESSOR OF QUENCHING 1, chloroplastic [Hondaea fermentalgiana]